MSKSSYYSQQKGKWDALASTWVDTGPPASPSDEDVENYKKLLIEGLSGLHTGKIILLGCTPKLRDMLSNYELFERFEVVCVDFSLTMYERTTRALKHPNKNERFELADWLTFDLGKEKFNAVFGDKVIDNIMPDEWTTFFARIRHHLCSNGSFIVHLALADDRFKKVTFFSAFEKWAYSHAQRKAPLEQIVSGLWEDTLTASAFKDGNYHNTVKIGRFADEVEELYRKRDSLTSVHQEILNEFIRVFWDSREDQWSSYQYQEILNKMSNYFVHDKTIYSRDYDVASIQPIVRMKAR